MVSSTFVGSLASRAIFLMSSHITHRTDSATYASYSVDGLKALQGWYNRETGLWDTTGWWNSANCLTVLADFAVIDPAASTSLNIPEIIQNTYDQAQKTPVKATKILSPIGLPVSSYIRVPASKRSELSKRGFDNFLNDYYDDEGWWALALIHSHDVGVKGMGDQEYLQAAVDIFEDMKKGNSTCGGIFWSKVTPYTNAIANELYLAVAASLANRIPSRKDYFLDVAKTQWDWFKKSGLINKDNLINDGLTDDCKNNGMNTWTYNQGVILGGLVELSKATGDKSLLTTAQTIASAAITKLSKDGILFEGCEPDCGSDGAQFKGIFMRNLHYLQAAAPMEPIKNFLLTNADTIWAKNRNDKNQLGTTWAGPFGNATAGTQSSALDTIVAAAAVA
ncbi:glycoside hydrolase family 76 protein [Daldinia caldariorum]|uniref:glycoside hydrolase family 76 protein n=1 Tax=Daldinia caldariorum TaxID=326644 RepID=UPI002008918E|nr:glycoside hydrolase family 76 protein [Daldinia caldariorum]KAI1470645.1 glycoside hydrolase family 76 protein [Daldinia caldariorum]